MSRLSLTTCRSVLVPCAVLALTVAVHDAGLQRADAQDAAPPTEFSAGVRSPGADQPEDTSAMQAMRPAAPAQDGTRPTLPGGKLPQYQLDHHRRTLPTDAELNDPRLRFLLVLPGRPLLIEATLTIDGQPYQMARENRIQSLLADLQREPEPVTEAKTETAADETPAVETPAVETPAAESQAVTTEPASGETAKPETAEPDADDAAPAGDAVAQPEDKEAAAPATQDADAGAPAPADSAAETPSEAAPEDAETEAPPEVTPPSVPAYSLPSTVLERLRRQVAVTGEAVSANELRWLLTNWIDGPTLLLLRDHFQQFRANQRPVFQILDRDSDGRVSADELSQAVASFEACDLNRNDIVDYSELERSAEDPRRRLIRHAGAGRLIFLLPDEKTAAATYERLAAACASEADVPPAAPLVPRFNADENGQFDAAELATLRDTTPDLRVTIAFDGTQPENSRLTVVVPPVAAGSAAPGVAVTDGTATATAVRLRIDGIPVELTAVQNGGSDQVSLGAVNDGYPLLGEIDPNDDGRFTIRELRTLVDQLKTFDRDQDGTLSRAEAHATIRVCFGLGATVHRELASLRRVDREPQPPATPGPGWFVRMDRNKDNDLSRKEFPGTDEQFAALDADGDLLISADEARNASP